MMSYVHTGMRHFLDVEADRLGLTPLLANTRQWRPGHTAEPLGQIERSISSCAVAPSGADLAAILANGRSMIPALTLSLLTGVRVTEALYRAYSFEVPEYVYLPDFLAGDNEGTLGKARKSGTAKTATTYFIAPRVDRPGDLIPDVYRDGDGWFLQAEAERLGLVDTETNGRPIAMARLAEPLAAIRTVAECARSAPPAGRAEVLGAGRISLGVLAVSLMAGVRALEAAYRGYGIEVPSWVSLALLERDSKVPAAA